MSQGGVRLDSFSDATYLISSGMVYRFASFSARRPRVDARWDGVSDARYLRVGARWDKVSDARCFRVGVR